MSILRLHHVGILCAEAGDTERFYRNVLGMQPLAAPVGVDVCLAGTAGERGGTLQFEARPGEPRGRRGIGFTHHVALTVPDPDALRRWKRRLADLGVQVRGPYERRYFQSIYFRDPDGLILEMATHGPGWTVDEPADRLGMAVQVPPDPYIAGRRDEAAIVSDTWPEPVPEVVPEMAVTGLHHVTAICSDIERTAEFCRTVLQMRLVKKTHNFDNPRVPHWYMAPGSGEPGSVLTYFGEGAIGTPRGALGLGLTHHIAFAADGNAGLHGLREREMFSDPDGHLLEVVVV